MRWKRSTPRWKRGRQRDRATMSGPNDWRRPDPQRLVASLPFAVLVIAPDLRVAAANPAAEQLAGQSARRLIGKRVADLLRFEEPRVLERLDEGDAQVSARGCMVRIGGAPPRQLDVMLAPVTHCSGWQLLSLHEATAFDTLSGDGGGEGAPLRAPEVLAHEIKNPLAGIRGAAQLLGRKLSENDRPLTELITAEVDRIAKLIDQMQNLSRKGFDPLVPCNLHEAVRRAQAILSVSDGGEVKVREEFDPSLPLILGASDALVQVVLNLISNAREACLEQPEPRVFLRTRFASGIQLFSERGGEAVPLPIELRISDNGPGIDPALRAHIFEPFVTSKKSGQGLGLALVQKLVREMNGRITHDREEATGLTHFRLHLPVAPSAMARKKVAA